ncbi:membrane protein [Neisseria arctica]|uniref:Membrane protein n=1 Tax=Neisseria arctica TaxID=1470200 RepID=A0A0J0YSU8_9NEIS|nr:DUF2868 domain-containing protein [Neisseria arctica]KLT73184.1 membrane protein [Neisseria arctica]UOO87083.1 DUF2868 domain-containing protein [Neisseria arctica]
MLNPSRQLTELVRLLQERGYIFSADPEPITETLRHTEGSPETKLNRRAEMIDSDHRLQDALTRVRSTFSWLLLAATLFWLFGGFTGTFTLMQQSGLNFFFILASVLGLHTFMLLAWLLFALMPRFKSNGFFVNPALWIRGKDPINQAILRLYGDEWHKPGMRWQISLISHRLWLAALSGMLAAVVLLLMVRQYTFNWESTLLSDGAFASIVQILTWLPAKLGFPTPDTQAVLASRMSGDTTTARQWGGLLIGSIICYGWLPRAAAWLICKWLAKSVQSPLPIEKPYYQQILQLWQTKIVDADIHTETVKSVQPKIRLDENTPKWAIMLESPWSDPTWHRHILGIHWLDKGIADSRDAVAALKQELSQQPVQLLVGVRTRQVPDRGILRQLLTLAEAAQGGVIVQLLAETDSHPSDGLQNYMEQWHTALAERQLAWIDPPRISQQSRTQPTIEK